MGTPKYRNKIPIRKITRPSAIQGRASGISSQMVPLPSQFRHMPNHIVPPKTRKNATIRSNVGISIPKNTDVTGQ